MPEPGEKKARGRWKYSHLYRMGSSGRYEYTGEYYCYDMTPGRVMHMKIIYSLLALLSIAVYVALGFMDLKSSRVFYVVLPYAGMFLPAAFMAADVFRIVAAKGKMTVSRYEGSVIQLRRVAVAMAVLGTLSAAGDVLFVMLNRADEMDNEIIYILGCLLIAVVDLFFWRIQKKYPCTVCGR